MKDAGGKLLNGIKSMYISSLVCLKVTFGVTQFLRTDRGVRCHASLNFECVDGLANESRENWRGVNGNEVFPWRRERKRG